MKALLLLAAAFAATPVFAQITVPPASDPGALQQQRIDEAERRRQLEQLERAPVTDPLRRDQLDTPAVRAEPGGPRFMVRQIRFTPSDILSSEELGELAAGYLGRELTFADLLALVDRINAAYRARRGVTPPALPPPQDVAEGIVTIRRVVGRLGTFRFDGNDSTQDGYITGRIGLKPGELVDLPTLEQDLIRFNRTNDVQLRAELKPGTVFATSDLEIKVEEPPRHDLRFTLDNAGSSSTGKWRTGLAYLNRSLLGFRDDLSVSTTHAHGQESYSVAYGIPINRSGGRLALAYYKDRIAVRRGPLSSLDLTGRSTGTVLSLRQPLRLGERSRLDLVAGAKRRHTTNWISGVFLQRTRTTDASLGLELQAADDTGIWLAGYSLVSGRADGMERDRYTLGRGSIRRLQTLADGWSARAGLSFQHTSHDLLPSSEQVLIGGEYSVRGYPVGSHAGDRGFTLNLELHHPLGRIGDESSGGAITANGFFFFDHGRVTPYRPPNSSLPRHEKLSSIGWGANLTIGKRTTARITFARALDRVPDESRRYQVHFQLAVSLF